MRLHHQLSVLAVVTAVSAAASPLAYGFDNRAPAPDTTQRAMAVQHHQNAPIWGSASASEPSRWWRPGLPSVSATAEPSPRAPPFPRHAIPCPAALPRSVQSRASQLRSGSQVKHRPSPPRRLGSRRSRSCIHCAKRQSSTNARTSCDARPNAGAKAAAASDL